MVDFTFLLFSVSSEPQKTWDKTLLSLWSQDVSPCPGNAESSSWSSGEERSVELAELSNPSPLRRAPVPLTVEDSSVPTTPEWVAWIFPGSVMASVTEYFQTPFFVQMWGCWTRWFSSLHLLPGAGLLTSSGQTGWTSFPHSLFPLVFEKTPVIFIIKVFWGRLRMILLPAFFLP